MMKRDPSAVFVSADEGAARCMVSRDKQGPGFVYVVAAGNELCKVGVSKNPRRREIELRHASAVTLNLFFSAPTPTPYTVEADVKKALAPLRTRGEWFSCHPLVAEANIRACMGEEPFIQLAQHAMDFALDKEGEGQSYYKIWKISKDFARKLDPFMAGIACAFDDLEREL